MSNGFSITIGAVDNSAKVFGQINRNLEKMQAPAKRFAQQITKFTEVSGLKKVGQTFEQITRSSLGFVRSISTIAEPLAAIGGAASIAGMAQLVNTWANFQTQLGFAAARMGVLPHDLAQIRAQAALAGGSADGMQAGFENLGQTLYDVAKGQAPQAAYIMSRLSISLTDAAGHARKAKDVLPALIAGLHNMKNPLAQAAAAAIFFGGAANDMLPVIRMSAKELEDNRQRVLRYGGTTDEGAAAALRFSKSQANVSQAVSGLTDAIATQLAPVISPLLDQLADWIAQARTSSFVTKDLGAAVKRFGDWIASISLDGVISSVTKFADQVQSAVDYCGGWKDVLEGLIGLKVASWLFPIVAGALSLTRAVVGLTTSVPILSAAMAAVGATYLAYTQTKQAYDNYVQRSADNKAALDSVAPSPEKQANFDRLGAAHQLPAPLQQHYDDLHRGNGRRGGPDAYAPGTTKTARGPHDLSDYNGTASGALTYFQSQGWTPAQAAGIVANIKSESGFKQNAVGDGGNAYGLGQWHADRQADFAKWAGHDIRGSTQAEQLGFYNYELTQGKEQAAGRRLRGATTANDAGGIVSRYDERPAAADEAASNRGALAESILRGAPGASGKVEVELTLKGAGAEKVIARSKGNVSAPKIYHAMPDAGFV